jgi:ribose 5-phosphate isomerase B
VTEKALAEKILQVWLETPFGGGRHQRRIDKIAEVEKELGTRIKDRT